MSTQLQLRRGLASAWTAANPILAQGEPGLETDTAKLKFGDGATAWTALGYFAPNSVGVSFSVIVSATLGATQDNYAASGWSATTTYLKLTAAVGGSVLSSLANVGTANSSAIALCNPSLTDAITFPHLTGSGVQFTCPGGVASVLGPNANTFLILDAGVWRFS